MPNSYEPDWLDLFHKGEYVAALEKAMLFPGASSTQIVGLSALVVAQAVGSVAQMIADYNEPRST